MCRLTEAICFDRLNDTLISTKKKSVLVENFRFFITINCKISVERDKI